MKSGAEDSCREPLTVAGSSRPELGNLDRCLVARGGGCRELLRSPCHARISQPRNADATKSSWLTGSTQTGRRNPRHPPVGSDATLRPQDPVWSAREEKPVGSCSNRSAPWGPRAQLPIPLTQSERSSESVSLRGCYTNGRVGAHAAPKGNASRPSCRPRKSPRATLESTAAEDVELAERGVGQRGNLKLVSKWTRRWRRAAKYGRSCGADDAIVPRLEPSGFTTRSRRRDHSAKRRKRGRSSWGIRPPAPVEAAVRPLVGPSSGP